MASATSNVFDVDSIDFNIQISPQHRPKKNEVLTPQELLNYQNRIISDVNVFLKVSPIIVRFLLNHFKWDKQQLLEKYFDSTTEEFLKSLNVTNLFTKPPTPQGPRNEPEECLICCCVLQPSFLTGLECGHRFCSGCWREYLTNKIMNEGLSHSIRCAGCDMLVDEATVAKLVANTEVQAKYKQLVINSFVASNPLLRWCPGVNCSYAVKVSICEVRPVTCKCTLLFCFACGEDWHGPVKCCLLKRWIAKHRDEADTINWIAVNTKACPRCNAPIEKIGGCNHMICTNGGCNYTFCWECLGNCPHGQCVRSVQTTSSSRDDASWARYMDYYNCYTNHRESLKSEKQLYNSLRYKMAQMGQDDIFKKAIDILCECRQTLVYSYVFAFFLKKNDQALIFEEYQKDLESATEKFSTYLKHDINIELVFIEQKVQDMHQYCDDGLNALLHHVHEGYDFDLWEYTES